MLSGRRTGPGSSGVPAGAHRVGPATVDPAPRANSPPPSQAPRGRGGCRRGLRQRAVAHARCGGTPGHGRVANWPTHAAGPSGARAGGRRGPACCGLRGQPSVSLALPGRGRGPGRDRRSRRGEVGAPGTGRDDRSSPRSPGPKGRPDCGRGRRGSGRLLELGSDEKWAIRADDLPEPSAVIEDGAGGLIVASGGRRQILHLAASGVRRVLAGEGPAGTSGDGGAPSAVRLERPAGLPAWQGGLLVADLGTRNLRWIEPAP